MTVLLSALTLTASFVLHLNAAPQAVFPFFDPVNETKWAPDWKPVLLGPRVEEGLVFLVGDGDDRSTWVLDRYDPVAHRIGYVVAAASTLTRIAITVQPDSDASVATVTYTRTALDAQANAAVERFAEHLPLEGPHWEAAINAALLRR